MNDENILKNNIDSLFMDLYEKKIGLEEVLEEMNASKSLSFLNVSKIDMNDFLKCFPKFIKNNMNNPKKSIKTNITDIKYYYRQMIIFIDNTNKKLSYKQLIEIIGNLAFGSKGIESELTNKKEKNEEIIQNYLLNKVQLFIKEKSHNNSEAILEFIKSNHIIFLTDNAFDKIRIQFFLIINTFLSEKYEKFSNYEDFIVNLYYLYYKYTQKEYFDEFKEAIFSKIDSANFSKFSMDENFINSQYISSLIKELNILISNKKKYELHINEHLLNNPNLLKLFNLKKVDIVDIKRFFKYSTIQDNFQKFLNNMEQEFDLSVDDLNYDENMLHVFNIFYIISCGLLSKMDKDCLQIFNGDNNVISLLKKYGETLINNVNNIIKYSELKSSDKNIVIPENEEKIGFGNIFKTYSVIYSDLNNNEYITQKLKFDLKDISVEKNVEKRPVYKIKVKIKGSDRNTNFTKVSGNSKKTKSEGEDYYEKLNGDTLEEGCKKYIISRIDDTINENCEEIKIIEICKIMFALNFFIPYIDEKGSLEFYPITKDLKNKSDNKKDYGYQEFDYLFQVFTKEKISMNQNSCEERLPFIKSIQIKFNCKDIKNPIISLEEKNDFYIKENALVLVENKNKFPKAKDKLNEYILVMLKKLDFVLKLLKKTSKDYYSIKNIQLLLIYDDIVFGSEEIKKLIDLEDIQNILEGISFSEERIFNIEIAYISQVVHYFNSFNDSREIKQLKNEIKKMKEELSNLKESIKELKSERKKDNSSYK